MGLTSSRVGRSDVHGPITHHRNPLSRVLHDIRRSFSSAQRWPSPPSFGLFHEPKVVRDRLLMFPQLRITFFLRSALYGIARRRPEACTADRDAVPMSAQSWLARCTADRDEVPMNAQSWSARCTAGGMYCTVVATNAQSFSACMTSTGRCRPHKRSIIFRDNTTRAPGGDEEHVCEEHVREEQARTPAGWVAVPTSAPSSSVGCRSEGRTLHGSVSLGIQK